MTEEIQFTDRYGGNPPSSLRACNGHCEGTGYIPVYVASGDRRKPSVTPLKENDPVLLELWQQAEAEKPCEDGWHFVRCPKCQGTGKASRYESLTRVPGWIVAGAKFIRTMHNNKPDHWSYPKNLYMLLKIVYVDDFRRAFGKGGK